MNSGKLRHLDPARLLTIAGALALAVMVLWTMVDIGARIIFNKPLHGTLDLVEVTLVLVASSPCRNASAVTSRSRSICSTRWCARARWRRCGSPARSRR
jgi:hypothetical protein